MGADGYDGFAAVDKLTRAERDDWGVAGDKRFGSQESAGFFDLQIAKNNTTKQDLRINDYLAIPPLQVLLSPTEGFLVCWFD